MISTQKKDFSGKKNGPSSVDREERRGGQEGKDGGNCQISTIGYPTGSQNIKGFLKFYTFIFGL
jgi:hypothetical protein